MFNGADTSITIGHNRTTRGIYHVFCNGMNDGLAFKVDSLDSIAMVFGSGIESDRKAQSRVQSLTEKGETATESLLFGHMIMMYFRLK